MRIIITWTSGAKTRYETSTLAEALRYLDLYQHETTIRKIKIH